jgi:cobalt-zinc-cadmium efflux system protein
MAVLPTAARASSLTEAGQGLRWAVLLTSLILAAEVVGGVFANSLALLSDAGHLFTDLVALGLSLIAVRQVQRPSNRRMTFGYHRVGILVALFNALTLIGITVAIFFGAALRFRDPPEVAGGLTLAVAVVGLVVNGIVMGLLWRRQRANLTVHSAFLHVIGDALGSLAVIVSGGVILVTSWFWFDPAISVFIGLIIAFGAWRILREGLSVLVEAAPAGLNVAELAAALADVPGVSDVHDLHVWSIAPGIRALSCHVRMDDRPISEGDRILGRVNELLATRFAIAHSTIQMETTDCEPNSFGCCLPVNEEWF